MLGRLEGAAVEQHGLGAALAGIVRRGAQQRGLPHPGDPVHDQHQRPLVQRQRGQRRPLAVAPRQFGGACLEQHPERRGRGVAHHRRAYGQVAVSPRRPRTPGAMTNPVLDPADPAFAGQAVYTSEFLARVYDPLVVRYTNRFLWRCPSTRLVKMYDEHVTDRHLDVGPGTGYYLDRCRFPSQAPALTLLDPNPNVLAAASARVKRYAPSVVAANVLEPIAVEGEQFDSIAPLARAALLAGDDRLQGTRVRAPRAAPEARRADLRQHRTGRRRASQRPGPPDHGLAEREGDLLEHGRRRRCAGARAVHPLRRGAGDDAGKRSRCSRRAGRGEPSSTLARVPAERRWARTARDVGPRCSRLRSRPSSRRWLPARSGRWRGCAA